MKTDPRRFAPLGLILALLGIISFILILILKGLANARIFTLPDLAVLDQYIWISVAVLVLGLALTAFLDPEATRKFFVGRQVQYGSNSLIMLVAFLGIIFFVNLMAYQNPMTKDVTESQENSLAPETLNILNKLPQPIDVRAYYSSQISSDSVQKLLDNFKRNSKGKLTYQLSDPVRDPYTAQQDGVSRDGTIVIHMGNRREPVNTESEQDIDAAIVRLINPEQRIIYFVTGHGERNTEQQEETSLTQVKAALQSKNYTVKLLNLAVEQNVPADAKVVVIAGPQQPLTTNEVAGLQAYLDKGGALIAMEDPRPLTKFGNAPDPLADMLAKWGITLEDDEVIDPNVSNPLYAAADPQAYANHPITEKLVGYNSLFPTTRSLKLAATAPAGVTLTPLAQTLISPNAAWGETTFSSIGNGNTPAFNAATDMKGPLVLAVAAEKTTPKSRLVAFGDSDFATDPYYQRGYGDIFINAVDWAAGQENLISLTPKNNIERTYEPPNQLSLVGIVLLSICLIPLLVVIAGVAAWYQRRRRG